MVAKVDFLFKCLKHECYINIHSRGGGNELIGACPELVTIRKMLKVLRVRYLSILKVKGFELNTCEDR